MNRVLLIGCLAKQNALLHLSSDDRVSQKWDLYSCTNLVINTVFFERLALLSSLLAQLDIQAFYKMPRLVLQDWFMQSYFGHSALIRLVWSLTPASL